MQIRIQNQSVMEQGILFLERLFNLYHHIHEIPNILRIVDERCAGIYVFVVCKARTHAGTLLHVNMVPCGNVGLHVIRCKTYTEFVVLDFFHATDFHTCCPPFRYSYSPRPLRTPSQ